MGQQTCIGSGTAVTAALLAQKAGSGFVYIATIAYESKDRGTKPLFLAGYKLSHDLNYDVIFQQ